MHRTVKVGILNGKPAEVNGTKAKSLRTGLEMLTDSKRAGQGKLPYLALDSFIWVFSADDERYARVHGAKRKYDFAAVDVRETNY